MIGGIGRLLVRRSRKHLSAHSPEPHIRSSQEQRTAYMNELEYRLSRLKKLKDDGAITQAEYDTRRLEIIIAV